jgi:hypothetical protein
MPPPADLDLIATRSRRQSKALEMAARSICKVSLAGLLAWFTPASWAELVIGQSSGVTGPVAAGVQ